MFLNSHNMDTTKGPDKWLKETSVFDRQPMLSGAISCELERALKSLDPKIRDVVMEINQKFFDKLFPLIDYVIAFENGDAGEPFQFLYESSIHSHSCRSAAFDALHMVERINNDVLKWTKSVDGEYRIPNRENSVSRYLIQHLIQRAEKEERVILTEDEYEKLKTCPFKKDSRFYTHLAGHQNEKYREFKVYSPEGEEIILFTLDPNDFYSKLYVFSTEPLGK